MVIVESVRRSEHAARGWLDRQDAPEAVIAAHEAGRAGDETAAPRWVRRLLDEQSDDGSWADHLGTTAETLLVLHELRAAADLREQDPGIGRAMDWLRRRQRARGAWTEGCDPLRHERGYCHHFMGGFFSPGPPEVPFEEVVLRSGTLLGADAEARFVTSVLALRAVSAWGAAGADARLHLDGLRRVVEDWATEPPPGLGIASLLAALTALVVAGSDDDLESVGQGLRLVAGRQRGDGSWVDADAFQALETLVAAAEVGVEPERTRRALWHGARLLISTQQGDGSWGREYGPRRALIALRAFRHLTAAPAPSQNPAPPPRRR